MTTFIDCAYNVLHILNQYVGAIWPVKVVFGTRHLQPPSEETEANILRIFHLLQSKSDAKKFGFNIVELVSSLPSTEDVLSVYDKNMGLNLMQVAIIDGNQDLVSCLIKWQFYSSGQNDRGCSHPVHLAAFLGKLTILKLLLDNGGKSNSFGGICYPDPHQPISYKKWLGIFNKPVYKCTKNSLLPIHWSVLNDKSACFVLLMDDMIEKGELTPDPISLLHFACQRGAHECIIKILSENPSIVNCMDTNNDTPLLMAVVWGKKCSKTLIDYGADVKTVSNSGETALHRLYRNDIDGLFTIYQTTKYLLTTGIEQLVNYNNSKGETPLHVLVTHVSYIGGSITNPHDASSQVPRPELQPDYQNQVVDTLDLLLKFNADPNIKNNYGLNPLAKLMHIALKSCSAQNEQDDCIKLSISSDFEYFNDYAHLNASLKVLLKHKSDLSNTCALGHTPLYLMLQCLMNDSIENLNEQRVDVNNIIDLLLVNGASVNKPNSNCLNVLAKIASRYFSISSGMSGEAENGDEIREDYSSLVNTLLETFLMNGLDPNLVTEVKSQHLKGGSGNGLIEFVRLTEMASCPEDFEHIHKCLKTLLALGANPDLEPYPSEPMICHSQSSIFLKRQGTQAVSHYIHEVKEIENIFNNGNAQELLMLFYNTMSHDILYNCLNTARFMSHFHPLGATGKSFLNMLNNLAENPRSLKQISRVAIYKSLDRQLMTKVPKLPLPTLLKNYLIEIY